MQNSTTQNVPDRVKWTAFIWCGTCKRCGEFKDTCAPYQLSKDGIHMGNGLNADSLCMKCAKLDKSNRQDHC